MTGLAMGRDLVPNVALRSSIKEKRDAGGGKAGRGW